MCNTSSPVDSSTTDFEGVSEARMFSRKAAMSSAFEREVLEIPAPEEVVIMLEVLRRHFCGIVGDLKICGGARAGEDAERERRWRC